MRQITRTPSKASGDCIVQLTYDNDVPSYVAYVIDGN